MSGRVSEVSVWSERVVSEWVSGLLVVVAVAGSDIRVAVAAVVRVLPAVSAPAVPAC